MSAEPLKGAANRRATAQPATAEQGTERRPERPPVEVRRSTRRRRTVSAYREAGRTVVLLPARMSADEERRWVQVMVDKLAAQDARKLLSDDELASRAAQLADRYLDGMAHPESVRWVTNQNSRWGSCTPSEGSIRISHRVQGMPEYVLDYVLLHELAHLLVPGHGADFWQLLDTYPRTERARGFLEGVVAADRLPHRPAGPDPATDETTDQL